MQIPENIGGFVKSFKVGAGRLVAAGTGDATEVTGVSIDRIGYQSGVFALVAEAVLAATKTLSVLVKEQQSADNSTWDTATTAAANAVVATGASGGSTETALVEIDLDFSGKKRYLRYNVTPDLSATATDTAHWGATVVAGGAQVTPA